MSPKARTAWQILEVWMVERGAAFLLGVGWSRAPFLDFVLLPLRSPSLGSEGGEHWAVRGGKM